MSIEDLINQRAALVAARSSGHLEVEFNSGGTRHRMVYRSLTDIIAAIAAVDRDIAALSGTRPRTFLPVFKTGFE
ncbi:hypothetical protein [Shinella sp.]|uniref:phage head-tail joining protein n=1 Tax=Shinella sp. TaxID=1870904 RepID=UPI0025908040|nr:hypothetical protein [Shinella sp.]MCW5706103.1 hypothetical protein [Shinella sp.]